MKRTRSFVDDLNGTCTRPVVAKWTGGSTRGGATLTPAGEALVETDDAVVAQSERANRAILDRLSAEMAGSGD